MDYRDYTKGLFWTTIGIHSPFPPKQQVVIERFGSYVE